MTVRFRENDYIGLGIGDILVAMPNIVYIARVSVSTSTPSIALTLHYRPLYL